ncbi:hypothetical protein A2866_03200 [Candidatus Roizmanbacteria bacterium RIFCSPHIGHO2_01_FULL_39_8]|uniref:Carbohydrate kinase PfkB domain-containing protein n=3 Tax=Candidatus Roizmaniibacteriota TaxID=1752723 RepID=A0A1F7GJI3_9BACT|nr:MAG: hypothetical protein A2866_03200 [Candidatus Roizmanbacteria bacterium RIFCSPHIGHO2_01_FULL_39_8]OGK27880.1 MAG: hypothetical protein A3C28_05480 [Candidatus Roizmanbacteria bacterium RIFCSPHIGHO2_02_FULL_39_9]OGK35784.1 MAG: hypothetical protein A3F60_01390 [Candidatus Roizmanbacteria bacterium RIFCSPHIGHO2_12_FULL_39_8]
MKNIIVTGSLAYDYIFDVNDYFSKYILPDKIHQINISVITDEYKKSFGGTAGNQAFYLGRLGLNPYIYASVGNDFSEYKKFLERNLVKTSFIKAYKNIASAAGFAMADKRDNQIWMYSIGAMKHATKLPLKKIIPLVEDPFVVIAPNDLQAVINYVHESVKLKLDFAFDPAFYVPHLSKELLLKAVTHAKVTFGNDYEIAFIEKKISRKITSLLRKNQVLVKTLADKGSEIFRAGKWTKVGIFKVKTIDPTGAGDAYRSGFLFGYMNNKPVKECGRMGAIAASFAVEIKGTMNLKFNLEVFEKRLNRF